MKNAKKVRKKLECGNAEYFKECWDDCFSQIYSLPEITTEGQQCLDGDEIEEFFSKLHCEKEKLNAVKSQLNSYDIVSWRKHTTNLHKCGFIVSHLKNRVHAEFVTQAWAKFYTILSTFHLIPANPDRITSVHLCEAPGAFVTSLNHYLQISCKHPIFLDWTATTLNPYYEGNELGHMIPDDRFMMKTLGNWDFGADFTGNIMCRENFEHFSKRFNENNLAQLVTADGSIDCSENPGEQENTVSLLFLWEVITALSILSDQGSFVLKIFTVFEKFTVSLLFFLHTVFKNVTLCKPGPSKPGNSEVYVISTGFMRTKCLSSSMFHDHLTAAFERDTSKAIVDFTKVPESYFMTIQNYIHKSCTRQKETIQMNIQSFEKLSNTQENELKELKNYIARRFLHAFHVKRIENFVSPFSEIKEDNCSMYDSFGKWMKMGSLNDRHKALSDVGTSEAYVRLGFSSDSELKWYESKSDPFVMCPMNLECITARKFDSLRSSAFCSPTHLKHWQEFKRMGKFDADQWINGEFVQLKALLSDSNIFDGEVKFICGSLENNIFQSVLGLNDYNGKSKPSTADLKNEKTLATELQFLIVCFLDISVNSKANNIDRIQQVLLQDNLKQSNVIFKLDRVPLTFFWNGILFLLTRCFDRLSLWKPNGSTNSIYMICIGFRNVESDIADVVTYLEKLQYLLKKQDKDRDITHAVKIYTLLHSRFRDFVISNNECFINALGK